jgi:hypothetical protein
LDGDIDCEMFVSILDSILDTILDIILDTILDIILYNNIVCSGIMIGIIHKIEKYGSLLLMFAVWRFFFSSLRC